MKQRKRVKRRGKVARLQASQGRGYQTRINRALRKLMSEERKISGE